MPRRISRMCLAAGMRPDTTAIYGQRSWRRTPHSHLRSPAAGSTRTRQPNSRHASSQPEHPGPRKIFTRPSGADFPRSTLSSGNAASRQVQNLEHTAKRHPPGTARRKLEARNVPRRSFTCTRSTGIQLYLALDRTQAFQIARCLSSRAHRRPARRGKSRVELAEIIEFRRDKLPTVAVSSPIPDAFPK